jgi:hypothetical protein
MAPQGAFLLEKRMRVYKEEQAPQSAILVLAIGITIAVAGFALWIIGVAASRGLL